MNKLLIANRGEIACRIIKTAASLGWKTVAVYSSADKHARHVTLSDEAFLLGDPPAQQSYLDQNRIIDIAVKADVTAIHPGYGFLAENAEFAALCVKHNIVFVGPGETAIRNMGLKGVARQQMQSAGVPVLPGINHITEATTAAEISELGYPLLIKPEAGGGGKGMRIVHQAEDLPGALESAAREATSAFGNNDLMVEKYLLAPRHIEIQIFADQVGNCVHLNERDCSLQRRHQKIIEESPADNFSEALREAMGQAAVAAARAIQYVGAGTVEFLLAEDGQFYFMEMNTRLQVEHPVTEMVTGVDLVAWQLAVAMGAELPCGQEDVERRGHAIEVRIYAEDPANNFLPDSGQITHLQLPEVHTGLRVDSGVLSGDRVGVFYDPMLMKIISWAADRSAAIAQLLSAVSQLQIAGIRTNRDFLHKLLSHRPFQTGSLGTDYLDQHLDKIQPATSESKQAGQICAASIYSLLQAIQTAPDSSPWVTETSFRLNSPALSQFCLEFDGDSHDIGVEKCPAHYIVSALGTSWRCGARLLNGRMEITLDQQQTQYEIHHNRDTVTLFGVSDTFEFKQSNGDFQQTDDEGSVQAPMAGKIVSILVEAGAKVDKGTPLAVIEAMKMEHTLIAPDDGIVAKVHFAVSDLVDEGIALFDFDLDEVQQKGLD